MKLKPTLSVVLPTYNCVGLMERHLASMASWLDLADEVIAVDSRSTDGTIELIRERLRHPGLRIIERDRGLYESWNEGIAATTGDWVYISTAGDTIARNHLVHLLEIGERGQADVVISPPLFVDKSGAPCKDPGWPPSIIVQSVGLNGPFLLKKHAGARLAFKHFPNAILGSSASNLYRGDHLRDRPFPTGFKGAGDSVWILRYATQSRLCFTPQIGSTFTVHEKEEVLCVDKMSILMAKLMAEKARHLTRDILDEKELIILAEHHRRTEEVQAIQRERRCLWHSRPLTSGNILSWAKSTVTYLRKRAMLKASFKRIQRMKLLIERPCIEQVLVATGP